MSTEHIVGKDEHLLSIARSHGFATIDPIWNHPDNAALKKLRKDPNILLEGDKVIIPDRQTKQESASTEKLNRFVAAGSALELHVKVQDQGRQPVKGDATLTTGATTTPMPQSGDIYKGPVAASANVGVLAFPLSKTQRQRPSIELRIGRLDPSDTLSGQQQRLNNLGYFAGFVVPKDPRAPDSQFRWAVEEFQCDHMGPENVDGVLGPKTLAALEKAYGDT
jgi:N-acetylmuramoyl-L-alanine amidase